MITKKTGYFKLVATANPQDYFEGAEAEDLRVCRITCSIIRAVIFAIGCLIDGYTVIVTREE